MKFLSVIYVAIIAACIVMFCYLMLYIPYECRNLAISSGGTATCGLEAGAYFVAAVSVVVGLAAAGMLIREQRKDKNT